MPQAPAASRLRQECHGARVELLEVADLDAPATLETLRCFAPDLLLVAGWPRLLKAPARELARLGTLNVHPSLLPLYRGRDPLFWALLRGEKQVGVTLHRMTEHVDSGPIVRQAAVEVPEGATQSSLADEVDRVGASLAAELARQLLVTGELPAGEPQRQTGSYFRPVRARDGCIAWSDSAVKIDRLIRACDGVVPAYTLYQGMKLVVLQASPCEPVDRPVCDVPGTVLELCDAHMMILAGSDTGLHTALSVHRWLFLGRVLSSGELAALLDLGPGARFEVEREM
jgi:methionyl-tRNA formyltransferase